MLLENVTEDINEIYEPILLKKLFMQGDKHYLNFENKVLEYSPNFRFYMTTRLSRPHYIPEICAKVTLLNFIVTP